MDKKTSYTEFSAQYKDKNIVILEFGRQYTRCGFAGESAPKAIIRSVANDRDGSQIQLLDINDPEKLQSCLTTFIERIYFNYLAASPKEKRVVIVESVFSKSLFRRVLAKVFFEQFSAPAVLFVPDHLMALASLGLSTGLVLDIGSIEAISIAVVDGVTLLDGSQFASLGSQRLDSLIYRALASCNDSVKSLLTPQVIEDIRVKSCFVAPYERGVKIAADKLKKTQAKILEAVEQNNKLGVEDEQQIWFNLSNQIEQCVILEDEESPASVDYSLGGCKTIRVPGSLREGACEIFFEIFGHEHSLATTMIETILMAPIDSRRSLADNVLVIGGLANLPGLEHRLASELMNINDYGTCKKHIPRRFKFHKALCPKNYVSWLGASMFCTSSFVELRSTTREQWLSSGMKAILDWSDLIH